MSSSLAVITLESDTGVPADRINFTFAVNQDGGGGKTPAEMEAEADAFIAFLNTNPGGVNRSGGAITQALAYYLSPVLDVGANRSTVKLYEIPAVAGALLGSPYYTKPFTLGPPITSPQPLPSEVAVALTLEAEGRSDAQVELTDGSRPKSRHTGRIFLGPLGTVASGLLNGVARPSTNLADTMINAALKLQTDLAAAYVTADLSVWSRRDNAVRGIEAVSVDDAFDTQRRRGEKASSRRRVVLA